MISVIVSTHNEANLNNVKRNVQQTIGVLHEFIAIDNKVGRGLCEVYNEGTKKARFEILCFAHEDIKVLTQNWGTIVARLFQTNTNLGLLGVAGGTYKSYAPTGWGLLEEARNINIIQHYKFHDLPVYNHYSNPKRQKLAKVACVDGVWMCTKKSIAQEIGFDQQLFTSFHCYDMDFSLSVSQKYDVAVTFEVLMEHYSEGKSDKNWVAEMLKFHKKWRAKLPVALESFSEDHLKAAEKTAIEEITTLMFDYNFSIITILKALNANNGNPYIDRAELRRMKLSAVKRYVRSLFSNYETIKES